MDKFLELQLYSNTILVEKLFDKNIERLATIATSNRIEKLIPVPVFFQKQQV